MPARTPHDRLHEALRTGQAAPAAQALKDGADPNVLYLADPELSRPRQVHPLSYILHTHSSRGVGARLKPDQRLALVQTLLAHGSDP